jgi:hypothetical protein
MAEPASDYHRGDMDITEQVATFRDAMIVTKWACLHVAVGVLFFTLLFCTQAGFIGSVVPAALLTAVGILVLKRRKPAH